MIENKLTNEELQNVNGGMILGYSKECDALFEKYNIEKGNMSALLEVCTPAERLQITRTMKDQMQNIVIPFLSQEKRLI